MSLHEAIPNCDGLPSRGEVPTLGSLSRKVTQLLLYLSRPKPPQSWGLNKDWADLPIAVTCMRDFLLNDLTKRWDTGNVLLGMAAFVDPRHKSLEWLKRHQQHTIQKQLLEEMFAVSGLQMTEIAPSNEDDAQIVKPRRFDDCDFLDEDEPDEQDTSKAAAGALQRVAVQGEYDAWLLVPEARVIDANSPIDPLAWWKMHDGQFPTIAKLARKYLAIPASSAPSERVFSRAKLIQQRQRWNLLPQRLEACVMLKHNAWLITSI